MKPRSNPASATSMLMKALLLIMAAGVSMKTAVAQNTSMCDAPEARAFDFWIGDWDIQQKILGRDGTWLSFKAKSSVSPALDGCALIEQWEGAVQFFWEGMLSPETIKGLSVRAYDRESDSWYIHWMDTRTPRFEGPYKGGFNGKRGEFFREWETPKGKRLGRITFSANTVDSVDWQLAVSSDGGREWSRLWIMEMRRTEE